MDRFIVSVEYEGQNRQYQVVPSESNGKMCYVVNVDGQDIQFIGNPSWDKGGAFLIPASVPAEIDLVLLEDIAEKIEDNFM